MSIVALTMNYKQSMKKAARTRQGWVPPAEGQLLVNTNASFDEYSHSGSTGVVIRDNHGGVIAASNKFLPHVVDAHMAETWALYDGLFLAQSIGANKVVCQTDCLEVVTTIQDGGFLATPAAAIYDECMNCGETSLKLPSNMVIVKRIWSLMVWLGKLLFLKLLVPG